MINTTLYETTSKRKFIDKCKCVTLERTFGGANTVLIFCTNQFFEEQKILCIY